MARSKVLLLLVALILSVGAGSALNFDVDVASEANVSVVDIKYDNSTSSFHNFNATIENYASVGCTYNLRAVYEHSDGQKEIRYSNSYKLWPGSNQVAEINYFPENYTGTVDAKVEIVFCDQKKDVKSFEFNSTENITLENEVESSTLQVNDNQAQVEFSVEKGHLVPHEMPAYWKTGYSEIVNGSATLEYNPPIFSEEKKLNYAVFSGEGEIIGETTVSLKNPEPTLKEKILDSKWLIFAGLFIVSLAGNGYLLRRKIVPDEVREKLAELEFGDRDIKK